MDLLNSEIFLFDCSVTAWLVCQADLRCRIRQKFNIKRDIPNTIDNHKTKQICE